VTLEPTLELGDRLIGKPTHGSPVRKGDATMDRRRATIVIFSATQENDVPSIPTRIDALGDGALEPGSYALPPLGHGHHPVAVVDVPAGYTHWGPSSTRPNRRSQRIR
jgi:hypothetical protein